MPKYNNAKKTHRYTEEFKAKAVQLSHLEGVQGTGVRSCVLQWLVRSDLAKGKT